jgi:hypothetical protein
MAKQKFVHYVPRPKPRKRPGRHKKRLNKHEKDNKKILDIYPINSYIIKILLERNNMKNKFEKRYAKALS